jgi:hypothetical protein
MTHHPDTLTVLRLICVSGIVTTRDIEDALPDVPNAAKHVVTLVNGQLINSEYIPSKAALHSIAEKGRRLLRKIDGAPMGEIAAPRTGIPTERYTGEKPIHTRPGSMAAYELPSLWNGERTERKRPIIVGARVEPVGVRG